MIIASQTDVGGQTRERMRGEIKKMVLGQAKNDGYQRAGRVGVSTGCRSSRWCRIKNSAVQMCTSLV